MELPADKALGRALDVLLLCNELKNAVTAGEEMNQLKGLYITNVCLSEGVDRYAVYVTTIYNWCDIIHQFTTIFFKAYSKRHIVKGICGG